MDKLTEMFANFQKMILKLWGSLSLTKKIVGLSAILLLGIGMSTIFITQDHSNRQYLFVDVQADDIAAITNYMKANNYNDYVIDQKGIKVPMEQVDRLRLLLSQEGLPRKGVVGWEKFDEENFTRTEFEQEVQKIRAIQGELSRTIGAIEGITSARVHIVVPKDSMFSRDEKKATAAIYLQTKAGVKLDKKQISGIQHLVSGSVEGLDINQITIVDSSGQMLSETEPEPGAYKQSQDLLSFKHTIEKTLEERVRSIVGKIVGIDRVEAKVDAQVDFTQEKQTISDVDPDNVAVVSKNSTGFSMEGQGLNPTGIPGSKSNVPGEQEDVAAITSKAGSKKESELVNYEVSKTLSEKVMSVGKIIRLTVSVIVDGSQIYPMDGTTPEFVQRSPAEMKQIEELIKNAVGFQDARDSLTVHNMMFQLDPFQVMDIKKQRKEDRAYLSTLAVSAVVALALILFFAFIVRPYFRWLSYDPEKKKEQSIIEEYKPDLEIAQMQNVKIQEDVPFEKMTPKEQVFYLARNEPKRTTEAIRMMLSPSLSG